MNDSHSLTCFYVLSMKIKEEKIKIDIKMNSK